METKLVDIDKVKPYKNNPRINEKAVEVVADSIKEFGWQQPIVVDKKNVIIVGHTRLLAAKELKLKKVPIHVANNLTPKQVKAYRVADNKVAEFAEWDIDLLRDELEGLNNIFTGFSDEELEDLLGSVGEEDFPELGAGEKEPFQQMTFSLHDDQVAIVDKAIKKAKLNKKYKSKLNDNSNGNALAFICKEFLK